MAFSIDAFQTVRPYLFHLTARCNFARIRELKKLLCATDLLTHAGASHLNTTKRPSGQLLKIEGDDVHIRDQAPLHSGNITFESGWTISKFISYLNKRIFFWPGTLRGPNDYGRRHFERYVAENPIIIRSSTNEILSANPRSEPLFCKYNSGAPRCTQGRGSPRGLSTFVSASEATFPATAVVEVTFLNQCALTENCEYSVSPNGPWKSIS